MGISMILVNYLVTILLYLKKNLHNIDYQTVEKKIVLNIDQENTWHTFYYSQQNTCFAQNVFQDRYNENHLVLIDFKNQFINYLEKCFKKKKRKTKNLNYHYYPHSFNIMNMEYIACCCTRWRLVPKSIARQYEGKKRFHCRYLEFSCNSYCDYCKYMGTDFCDCIESNIKNATTTNLS